MKVSSRLSELYRRLKELESKDTAQKGMFQPRMPSFSISTMLR